MNAFLQGLCLILFNGNNGTFLFMENFFPTKGELSTENTVV